MDWTGGLDWTDKLLYYTHNKTSHPWLVNNRYSETSKEYGLHKVHAPDNLSDVLQVYIAILPIMFKACKKT